MQLNSDMGSQHLQQSCKTIANLFSSCDPTKQKVLASLSCCKISLIITDQRIILIISATFRLLSFFDSWTSTKIDNIVYSAAITGSICIDPLLDLSLGSSKDLPW